VDKKLYRQAKGYLKGWQPFGVLVKGSSNKRFMEIFTSWLGFKILVFV